MEQIFSSYGIDILRDQDHYYLRCDSGGIVSRDIIAQVSRDDAMKAMKSEADAHAVIVAYENAGKFSPDTE